MKEYGSPVISVIMSVFSEPISWLRESINSILLQTFSDFEFIIVNDNPARIENDLLLEEYKQKDKRILVIRNEKNIGLTRSLNVGLKIAKGIYIARMDADDVALPERFEKQVYYMDTHLDVIVLGTNIKYIGDVPFMTLSDWIKQEDRAIKAQMLFNSGFAHSTVMIRKSVLSEKNIYYDVEYKQSQDYRLWEVLYDLGKFANLPDKLLLYRLSNLQISKKANAKQVNYGRMISRRLISKWICKIEGCSYTMYTSKSEVWKLKRDIKSKIRSIDSIFYEAFIRTLYFSQDNSRILFFFRSLVNGDFFFFSFLNKLRYLFILLHLKKTVIW